ncbi:hypothetical protein [Glycomyces dulcitolivorans]|uniref:hypothetical protein n=1 Tax=Glycomyces dulcitolivorans TaxID=2200759 RepID=UPI000DD39782|nr:hypothetical protein [Glycomyces dulcitolivorans]
MTQLSELAAYIGADKSEAEALESYLLGSRDIANDLRAAFAHLGAERKTGQLGTVADLLGAAQNSRWLTVGHLEDALLIIKGAMTGDYSGSGALTPRTNPDGSRVLLGDYGESSVSLRVVTTRLPPNIARLRAHLGMPTTAPEALDTTGDEGVRKLGQVGRKVIRNGSDLHAQAKETANTNLVLSTRGERPANDTPHVTPDGVATIVIISAMTVDGITRLIRDSPRRTP